MPQTACTPAAAGQLAWPEPPVVSPAIRATHEDLSPLAGRFLQYVLDHPQAAHHADYRRMESLPAWVRRYPYPLQPWPALVGASKLRRIERATVGVTRLVQSIPERLFGGDPRRICEFYDWADERLVGLVLEPPNGLATALARCDFVDDGSNFKCLELNMSAFIGGWQHRFFEGACRATPAVADFLAQEGAAARFRDSWPEALAFIVEQGRRQGHAVGDRFNIAVVVDDAHGWGESLITFDEIFQAALRDSGSSLTGRILRCSYPGGLVARGGALYCQDVAVSVVIEFTSEPTPRDVYRIFKARRLALYNGPISGLLGNKRNLALLSQHEESDLFTAEERRLIRDHVPWSRELTAEHTTFQGERIHLVDFALAHRASLVLKAADGYSGVDVHIGSRTEPELWRRLLAEAFGKRTMLLQQYVTSRPYLYQSGGQGLAAHQVVWGTFCFGAVYGGGFLRMLQLDRGPGVINSAQGATEGLILEI